ncbi:MAG: exosortase/archaeosortase family protein [Ferruginibacter sp.]
MVGVFGYNSYLRDAYHIAMPGGRGIHLAYDCYGYGILSFWIAFIYANKGSVRKKLIWICSGCLLIWLINVGRLSLMLISINKNWKLPYDWEHHTSYNVILYACIFLMIWLFQRSEKKQLVPSK